MLSCLATSATQTATILHLFGCLTSSAVFSYTWLLSYIMTIHFLVGTWFFNPPYSRLSPFISYCIILGEDMKRKYIVRDTGWVSNGADKGTMHAVEHGSDLFSWQKWNIYTHKIISRRGELYQHDGFKICHAHSIGSQTLQQCPKCGEVTFHWVAYMPSESLLTLKQESGARTPEKCLRPLPTWACFTGHRRVGSRQLANP